MKNVMVALIGYLVVVSMAAAGYTDPLWEQSEDRIYYDCGDWSGVDNHKDLQLKEYIWGFDHDDSDNAARAWDPCRYGLPHDVRFTHASNPNPHGINNDNIWWIFLYINGFDKTLNHDTCIYTDDRTKINYIQGYLKISDPPSAGGWKILKARSVSTNHIDKDACTQKTLISIKYKTIRCNTFGCVILYKTCNNTLSKKIECEQWGNVNQSIIVEIVNHSNYMLLYVPTPDNLTGIKILIESDNVTALYEKHTHCMKLNTSQTFKTCDLVRYEYHNFTEITPFGCDTYLLQYEPDYTFNVTLYTPFETIDADLTINETDAEPINIDLNHASIWDVLYIIVPISLILWLVGMI